MALSSSMALSWHAWNPDNAPSVHGSSETPGTVPLQISRAVVPFVGSKEFAKKEPGDSSEPC